MVLPSGWASSALSRWAGAISLCPREAASGNLVPKRTVQLRARVTGVAQSKATVQRLLGRPPVVLHARPQEVHRRRAHEPADEPVDGIAVEVHGGIELDEQEVVLDLKSGVNHLLVKVANVDGTWGFRMRRSEAGVSQAAINEAIDRGVQWLLERQLVDGSWGAEAKYGPAYTAYYFDAAGLHKAEA